MAPPSFLKHTLPLNAVVSLLVNCRFQNNSESAKDEGQWTNLCPLSAILCLLVAADFVERESGGQRCPRSRQHHSFYTSLLNCEIFFE